ncbi:hypothetical protein RI367_003220 [Sorochytrium milnesiophthora]
MCGRTALNVPAVRVRQAANVARWVDEDKYRPSTNVCPQRYQPALLQGKGQQSERYLHSMRWGLVPSQTQDAREFLSSFKTINARDDSVIEGKRMFRSIRNNQRCIVFAEGYYEWQTKGTRKQPFLMRRKDGKLLRLAAMYDIATVDGETLYTYTLMTTSPASSLTFIHDRMPVILGEEDADAWLSDVPWNDRMVACIKSNDNGLEHFKVDPRVGKVGVEDEAFLRPLDDKPGSLKSLWSTQAKTSPQSTPKRPASQAFADLLEGAEEDEAKRLKSNSSSPTPSARTPTKTSPSSSKPTKPTTRAITSFFAPK